MANFASSGQPPMHQQNPRPTSSSSHHQHHSSSSSYRCINASQAWATLERHKRKDIDPVKLRQLLRDNDRVSSLVAVYSTESDVPSSMTVDHGHSNNTGVNGKESRTIIVDMSRQRMTMDTMNLLFRYASAKDLKRYMERVAWGGQNDPRNPVVPARIRKQQQEQQQKQHKKQALLGHHHRATHSSTTFLEMEAAEDEDDHQRRNAQGNSTSNSGITSMHMALRVPNDRGCEMLDQKGNNVLPEIHREWDRIERTSDCYRRGQLRGATGSMIQNVIVIGRGVPVATIQFVYAALMKDERAQLASRFGLAPPETATTRLRRNLAAAAAVTGSAVAAAVMSPGGHYPGAAASGAASVGGAPMSSIPASRRTIRVLSSIDPIAAAEIVADLDPASTLVVSIALHGDEETGLATKAMKSWLLNSLATSNSTNSTSNSSHQYHNRKPPDYVLKHHMVLVTGNDHIAAVINKPESVHVIPQHARCEAFTSFTSAVSLPLSIVFGWTIVKEFLDGAHDMDNHFVSSHMRHNLPVLLALCDVWNGAFLGLSSRLIAPFSRSFVSFPALVTALESQACSRPIPNPEPSHSASAKPSCGDACPALAVDGGTDGAYDRFLYQSKHVVNTELIVSFDNQIEFHAHRNAGPNGLVDAFSCQDSHMCSLFAHADELALGNASNNKDLNELMSFGSAATALPDDVDASDGNRPSILVFTGKVDAFVCGQLVALAEHRAIVKSHLLGLDPFVRRCGASMRLHRSDLLKETLHSMFQGGDSELDEEEEGDDRADPSLNLATRTMLRHYANHSMNFKLHSVKEG